MYSTLRGVVLKYNEPPEARKPTKSWRLYVFKGKEQVGESFEPSVPVVRIPTRMYLQTSSMFIDNQRT